ncbi:flagellar M-ring protein FliF [Skermanella aerolata]|uniref:Flagellar M-ring protein n=1 Tax=Skermanella aerolata TaxID=393310 RepID=A0A512E2H2_9PROT|nr:flagellar basal-body MS-ring/collar protein FliF [Skermanella aerolata]KJB90291.1 flagellar M-ring protein FliF [Skermanella aerolata KACC 11604]GEO42921.1 flagellar M-ring protein [Skermanella aerolata]
MNTFFQTLRNLGPVRLAAMGVVALGLIGFFFYLMTRLSTPDMALLYSDLDPKDGGAIVRQLEEQKVPHQVNAEGTRIMVPADQVGRLRMVMAQAGLPAGGSIGYEIYDKPEGFGTTSFVQGVNHLRATEGELARTVATLGPVLQARVHLVLPKREMFSRTQQTATASVFLKLRPGQQLKREQVVAIQHLIAAAVPQLEPNQISIIDDRGNLLARGMGTGAEANSQANADEKKQAYEQRTTRVIEDLLSRSLGFGKVRAEVTADLDFDRITTSSEIFDPESQVIRSTQTVEDNNESTDRDALDPVTVANQLPTGDTNQSANGASSKTKGARTEETINYEISKTVKSHVRESGQVRRLSVAVLVDGQYTPNPEGGAPTYAPRPKEEMAQIEALVRSAIGFDAVRGDTVEVINMRFATPDAEFADGSEAIFLGMAKEDLFRIAEMVVLAIVAILVILLVIRPLMARAFERNDGSSAEEEAERLLTDQSMGQAQLTGPGALAQDLALEDAQAGEELEQMIDINRVEGRVRASSLRKVGEIVDKHPEEAVSIIRSWLYQET